MCIVYVIDERHRNLTNLGISNIFCEGKLKIDLSLFPTFGGQALGQTGVLPDTFFYGVWKFGSFR